MLHTGAIETRNVFLDTSVLISTNFGDSASFRSLVTMANMGGASFVSTDVTMREVRSHIATSVQDAIRQLKKTSSKVAVLRRFTPEFVSLFQSLDEQALTTAVWEELHMDLGKGDLRVIPVKDVDPERVFARYFKAEPPFSRGKKKAEFPDAFALCALEDWCAEQGTKVYVLSEDADWKNACTDSPSLIHIDLSDLLKMLWAEENEANQVAFFRYNFAKIRDAIEKVFLNAGTILNDRKGDVTSLAVNELEVEIESVSDDPNGEVVLVCSGSVDFTADVSYADPDDTTYDRESGHPSVWKYKKGAVDRTVKLDVEVRVTQHDTDYEVVSVVINNSLPIIVELDEGLESSR